MSDSNFKSWWKWAHDGGSAAMTLLLTYQYIYIHTHTHCSAAPFALFCGSNGCRNTVKTTLSLATGPQRATPSFLRLTTRTHTRTCRSTHLHIQKAIQLVSHVNGLQYRCLFYVFLIKYIARDASVLVYVCVCVCPQVINFWWLASRAHGFPSTLPLYRFIGALVNLKWCHSQISLLSLTCSVVCPSPSISLIYSLPCPCGTLHACI